MSQSVCRDELDSSLNSKTKGLMSQSWS